MELPQTLHGQLYLLAYDRSARQFRYDYGGSWRKPEWRFELALRSAMLTDLYLAGYIENQNGEACRVKSRHADPLLHEMLNCVAGRGWSELIYRGGGTCREVHDQLEAAGWIYGQPRRKLGLGRTRLEIYDDDMVSGLADRVTDTLRGILEDRPVDPRSLAVGLIAVQAQLSVVSGFIDNGYDREQLREMTLAATEPILGLYNAIHFRLDDVRRSMGGGGGCSGG